MLHTSVCDLLGIESPIIQAGMGPFTSTTPRALHSPFIDEWQNRRDAAKQEAERLRDEVEAAVAQGRLGELFPFTGQTAGLIKDVLPAAEIVHRLVAEAEEALQRTAHIASIR